MTTFSSIFRFCLGGLFCLFRFPTVWLVVLMVKKVNTYILEILMGIIPWKQWNCWNGIMKGNTKKIFVEEGCIIRSISLCLQFSYFRLRKIGHFNCTKNKVFNFFIIEINQLYLIKSRLNTTTYHNNNLFLLK